MDERALRVTTDDQANRLADIQSTLLFLQRATEFSETSDEVSEGFLQAARATLPGQVKALGEIIEDLKAGAGGADDLEHDPRLNEIFDGE
jgi:hypothetical protein